MTKRVLVCYATRYGSTAGIAQIIGEELEKSGFLVDVINVLEIEDTAPYDAIVIGSPLYMGKWLVEARDFVQRFKHPLNQRMVFVFTVGYSLKDLARENIKSAEEALDTIRLDINPSDAAFFAGMVNPDIMSVQDAAITRMGRVDAGDFRDWGRIREWAAKLAEELRSSP
ncbi:MAG: hypothetical protein APR55_09855 [Methanolinea sp. SDB]|nr:MAG: hypothetical protein APR55_09855 [Methanolinea sp. SDB]